jgi:hypothetical protein
VASTESAPGVRAALNALLYRTGELSRDVVLVIATNRPEARPVTASMLYRRTSQFSRIPQMVVNTLQIGRLE